MSKDPFKKLFNNVKLVAQRHGSVQLNKEIPCQPRSLEITIDDLRQQFQKQDGKCYWSGVLFNPQEIFVKGSPLAMSVDRIDNTQGYTKSNIVLALRFVNLGRRTASPDVTIKTINLIRETWLSKPIQDYTIPLIKSNILEYLLCQNNDHQNLPCES